jgi:hypothetical protein
MCNNKNDAVATHGHPTSLFFFLSFFIVSVSQRIQSAVADSDAESSAGGVDVFLSYLIVQTTVCPKFGYVLFIFFCLIKSKIH